MQEFYTLEIKQFNLNKPRSYKIVKRLVNAGLVIHEYILRNRHGVYRLTRVGAGCTDLPVLKYISLGSYLHQLKVVDVYLNLMQQYPDATWISERRLKRDKYANRRFERLSHIGDGMLIFPDDKKIAIKVELTMKGKHRLDKIVGSYALNSSIDGVWYFCAPEILNKIKKATGWCRGVKVFGVGVIVI